MNVLFSQIFSSVIQPEGKSRQVKVQLLFNTAWLCNIYNYGSVYLYRSFLYQCLDVQILMPLILTFSLLNLPMLERRASNLDINPSAGLSLLYVLTRTCENTKSSHRLQSFAANPLIIVVCDVPFSILNSSPKKLFLAACRKRPLILIPELSEFRFPLRLIVSISTGGENSFLRFPWCGNKSHSDITERGSKSISRPVASDIQ